MQTRLYIALRVLLVWADPISRWKPPQTRQFQRLRFIILHAVQKKQKKASHPVDYPSRCDDLTKCCYDRCCTENKYLQTQWFKIIQIYQANPFLYHGSKVTVKLFNLELSKHVSNYFNQPLCSKKEKHGRCIGEGCYGYGFEFGSQVEVMF